jgi:hypothetical protein
MLCLASVNYVPVCFHVSRACRFAGGPRSRRSADAAGAQVRISIVLEPLLRLHGLVSCSWSQSRACLYKVGACRYVGLFLVSHVRFATQTWLLVIACVSAARRPRARSVRRASSSCASSSSSGWLRGVVAVVGCPLVRFVVELLPYRATSADMFHLAAA